MGNSPHSYVNSKHAKVGKSGVGLKPKLELVKPSLAATTPQTNVPFLADYDFSTPPWLLAPADGFLDVDGVIPVDSLDQLARYWLNDRRNSKQRSERTLETYQDSLRFLDWFLHARGCEGCGEKELFQFQEYCRVGHSLPGGRWGNPAMTKPLSGRTINIYYTNLRAFFNWAVKNRFISVSPLERIEAPSYKLPGIKPFTREHIDKLLNAAKNGDQPHRDFALITFLYDTGLRVDEMCNLCLPEINWQEGTARILHGKGDKERTIIFSPEAAATVWDYLRIDKRSHPGPVFPSQRQLRMTRSGGLQLFERVGKRAGITGVRCSPHTMRHTYATHALENGATEEEVRRQLGHTSLRTTRQYVDLTDKFKCERHQSYSPFACHLRTSDSIKKRGRPSRNW